jgi:DNA-binding transcriptional LysR family regulator
MRFEQLEQFVALGNLRHFRQAAEQTKISTSALTRSIQTLEDDIGSELVKRSTRSVKLTEQGEIFLEYCKKTLAELQATKKTIHQSVFGREHNKLVIGYTNRASNIVPSSCGQFLADFPHVKIEMQLQDEDELNRKLQLGEIDVSVFSQSTSNQSSDVHLPDQLILFVAKNHPLANIEDLKKPDLNVYPLFGCFAQSPQVQTMLNEAVEGLNKSPSLKMGNIEQVIDGLKSTNHFAIASIEHSKVIGKDPELVLLKTNKSIETEQLVVQTNGTVEKDSHLSHLLNLIDQAQA